MLSSFATMSTLPLSLDDLPPELIEIIAGHLHWSTKKTYNFASCLCDRMRRIAEIPDQSFDLSTSSFDTYSDPSWALSCASKRYRQIVFHAYMRRHCILVCCNYCVGNVITIPEQIRASTLYVQKAEGDER